MEVEAAPSEHENPPYQAQTNSERAVSWASRRGYDGRTSSDLIKIAKISERINIEPTDLVGLEGLDRGAFGAIMKATYKGCPIAVKSIIQNDHDGKSGYSQDIRNVLLELAIVCRLNHPHVVAFYGMSTHFPEDAEDDNNFQLGFVFELCSQGSLFSNLHETQIQFSFASKMRILREVATGMTYLHEENIIHRDLSSRNILLTQNFTVKIADFGCARKLVGETYDSSTISGSPSYMPPEQLCGELLTLKVDVWALGTMMWELICEQVPWRGHVFNSVKGLREKIVKKGERLPQPEEDSVPPGTHDLLVKLLKSCFQKKVDLRPKMCQVEDQLMSIQEVICPADWIPNRTLTAKDALSQRPECLLPENPDTVQSPMGPAQLEKRLRAYYKIHNPSKLRDVKLVASNFKNDQMKLNEQLRSRYNCDLWDMDEPRVATPTPVKGLRRVDPKTLPKVGSEHSLDGKVQDSGSESGAERHPSPDLAQEFKDERPAMGAVELQERLEAFYEAHNPIKALNAKEIAAKFVTRQAILNSQLRERYHCDLYDPIAPKPCESEGKLNEGPVVVEHKGSGDCDAEPASMDQKETEADVAETVSDFVGLDQPTCVDSESVDQGQNVAVVDSSSPAPMPQTDTSDNSAQVELSEPHEVRQHEGALPAAAVEDTSGCNASAVLPATGPSVSLDAPLSTEHVSGFTDDVQLTSGPASNATAVASQAKPAGSMKVKDVAAKLRTIYSYLNPKKKRMAEAVVRHHKSVAALNRELQSKYGIDLSSSVAEIKLAAAAKQAQTAAKPAAEDATIQREEAAPAEEADAAAKVVHDDNQTPFPHAEAACEADSAETALLEVAEEGGAEDVVEAEGSGAEESVQDVGAAAIETEVPVVRDAEAVEDAQRDRAVPDTDAEAQDRDEELPEQASTVAPAADEGDERDEGQATEVPQLVIPTTVTSEDEGSLGTTSTPGASTPGASTPGASQVGSSTHRGGGEGSERGKFAGTEPSRELDQGQLESRLRVYYQVHNAEKLPLVREIAAKFVRKQEQLNESLRSRYRCELWEVDEAALCDSVLNERAGRSRQSSVTSEHEGSDAEKEGKPRGKSVSPSKTCSEADTEKCAEEAISDEETAASRHSLSTSPTPLKPVAEGEQMGAPQAPNRRSQNVAQTLQFLYSRANPTKLGLVAGVLTKYKGNIDGLNEVLQKKYGVDLDTPREEVIKRYPLSTTRNAAAAVKRVVAKAK